MPLTCSRSTRRSVCSTMAPIHPTIFIICTADLFIIRNLLPFLRSAEFRQLYAVRLLSVCVDQIFHLFNSQIAAQYFYISPLHYTQTHQPTKNAAPSSLLGRKKTRAKEKTRNPTTCLSTTWHFELHILLLQDLYTLSRGRGKYDWRIKSAIEKQLPYPFL